MTDAAFTAAADCKSLTGMVGAAGFEPATPAV